MVTRYSSAVCLLVITTSPFLMMNVTSPGRLSSTRLSALRSVVFVTVLVIGVSVPIPSRSSESVSIETSIP
ncbi:MAG TPA: hypothetical protein DCQ98_05435 [Planctomycetaceae bacterium]|nr:hypothetical protein [Planctomycetaceae bacterium]